MLINIRAIHGSDPDEATITSAWRRREGSQPTFLDLTSTTMGKATPNSELTFLGLPILNLPPTMLCRFAGSMMPSKRLFSPKIFIVVHENVGPDYLLCLY